MDGALCGSTTVVRIPVNDRIEIHYHVWTLIKGGLLER